MQLWWRPPVLIALVTTAILFSVGSCTAQDATLVKDINPNSGPNYWPEYLTAFDGKLFFKANDVTHGGELWMSDGTSDGTVLVRDINPGGDSFLWTYGKHDELMFLGANDGAHGQELWKSDGSEIGTLMVQDIQQGPEGSAASGMTPVHETLFFIANDGSTGNEIWALRSEKYIFSDDFETGGTGSWSSVVGEPPPELLVILDQPFPDTPAGACSPPEDLILQNLAAGTLNIDSLSLGGRFFFQLAQGQVEGPISIPPFGFADTLNLYFCPDIDNNQTYTGQLVIRSNDPGSPQTVPLSGTELAVVEIYTAPYGDGETWVFPGTTQGFCSDTEVLTISNTGSSDLSLGSVISSSIDFHIVNPPAPNTIVSPAETYDLEVEFCPDLSGPGPRSGTLSIRHDAGNQPDPIIIGFEGTAFE